MVLPMSADCSDIWRLQICLLKQLIHCFCVSQDLCSSGLKEVLTASRAPASPLGPILAKTASIPSSLVPDISPI
jgi:hypothetical protein